MDSKLGKDKVWRREGEREGVLEVISVNGALPVPMYPGFRCVCVRGGGGGGGVCGLLLINS